MTFMFFLVKSLLISEKKKAFHTYQHIFQCSVMLSPLFVSLFLPCSAPKQQEKKRKADEAAEEPAPKEVKVVPPQVGVL